MYLGSWKIDDYVPIPATCHRWSSGAAYAPTAITYSIYEDGSTAHLDDDVDMVPASPFDAIVGLYYSRRQLTTAAGFEKGKNYIVVIKATVDGVAALAVHTFQIEAEVDSNAVSDKTGYTASTVSDKTGYALTVTPPTAGDIATAVWDDAVAGHTTGTTFGGKLQTAVSTPPSAADVAGAVWDEATLGHDDADSFGGAIVGGTSPASIADAVWNDLVASHTGATSFGGVLQAKPDEAPTAADVADAVWDEAVSGHTTATTFGGKLQTAVSAMPSAQSTSGGSQYYSIQKDATNQSVMVYIVGDGGAISGLLYTEVEAFYIRNRKAVASVAMAPLVAADSAHSDGGWFSCDADDAPGWYRYDLPDAALATGADSVQIIVHPLIGGRATPVNIQLKDAASEGGGGAVIVPDLTYTVPKSSVSQSLMVHAIDSTTGAAKTGLAYDDMTAYYTRARGTATAISVITLATPASAYASGGFKEIDATNCPGWYRFDLPNAVFATGVDAVVVTMAASGSLLSPLEISLQDGTTFTVVGNAAMNASQDVEQDVQIWEGSNAPSLTWTITDANGDAVNLSTYTLKLIAYDYGSNTKFTLTSGGGGLVVSGSSSNVVTATYTTTHSSYLDTLRYELWRSDGGTTGDQVLAAGAWVVVPTQKWTA